MREGSTRIAVSMAGLFLLTLILFMADMLIGSTQMAASDVLKALFSSGPAGDEIIVMQFRLPKALTAVLAGAAMSVSGLLMQTLFRNPLAGPDVMGVSSGAGPGSKYHSPPGKNAPLSQGEKRGERQQREGYAQAGAGAVMIIIMAVSARMRDIMTVLIVGMLLASAISAVVSLMQYFSNEVMLRTYVIWTMGNLGNISYPQIRALALATAAGLAIAFTMVKPLNAILMGETFSRTVGVRMQRTRIILLASASILAGSVTAFCGPLAFIGVAVPHIARLLFGTADHRILMPATALTGAVILLLSDIISVMPGGGHVIPVNTVTSLIGIPVVLWIILGKAGLGRRF